MKLGLGRNSGWANSQALQDELLQLEEAEAELEAELAAVPPRISLPMDEDPELKAIEKELDELGDDFDDGGGEGAPDPSGSDVASAHPMEQMMAAVRPFEGSTLDPPPSVP